jgi:hypothetical protein
MILADVTKSLQKGEVEQVAKLTADVLDKFPDQTDYVIYPIHRETEKPTAIDEGHGSAIKLTPDDKESRRKRIGDKITQQYDEINERQPTDRTCILNTLELADKHFRQVGSSSSEGKDACLELVVISDMIEQCALNAGNVRIDLKEQPTSEAISKLDAIAKFPNLARIHITIIIPTSEKATPYVADRPTLSSLETFWTAVFTRCGFKTEDVENFNWLPSIPSRLSTVCQ